MTTSETPPPETSPFVRPVQWLLRRLVGSPHSPALDQDLPVTETLELLVPERRQVILEELASAEQTPLSTSTLAERVACAEYECRSEALADDQRKRVYIALTQSHLPALSDANVILYDSETRLVDRGPEFARLWRTYIAVLDALS